MQNAYWEEVQTAYNTVIDHVKGEYEEDFIAAIELRIKYRQKLTDGQFMHLKRLETKYL